MKRIFLWLVLSSLGAVMCQAQNESAFLGVYANLITVEKAKQLGFENPYGIYIGGTLANTAAEKAGILPFDYIFGLDEYRVGKEQSLLDILAKYQPGDSVTIHFRRNGQYRMSSTQLGTRTEAQEKKPEPCQAAFLGVSPAFDYCTVQGALVNIVTPSAAATMGLRDGDLINRINNWPIIDWMDLSTAIDLLQAGQTLKIQYIRKGVTQQLTGKLWSVCDR